MVNLTYDIPPTWEQVFLDVAFDMAKKSKDSSTKVGAVLVGEGNIVLATGFNGPPEPINDDLVPWDKRPDKYAFIIHAEENALLTALDSHGKREITGSTLYCTHCPCAGCTLRLIRSKVRCIVVPQNTPAYPLTTFEPVSYTRILQAQKLISSNMYLRYYPYERYNQIPPVPAEGSKPGDAT